MSDILQYKALANKIEEALNEKVIGDVNVEYYSYTFGTIIKVMIEDPSKEKTVPHYYDHYSFTLDDFIIKDSFDNEEKTSKLISEIVSNILGKYKEDVYKRYFFD